MPEDRSFSRFEKFGSVADEKTRREMVAYLLRELGSQQKGSNPLSDEGTEHFGPTLEQILDHPLLRELCQKDPHLAEEIGKEVLEFIEKTQKQIHSPDDPHIEEAARLEKFRTVEPQDFSREWDDARRFLDGNYPKDQIDTAFYQREFEESLAGKEFKVGKQNFESVRKHLSEQWDACLKAKRTARAKKIIDENRKKFCADLYDRLEKMKHLQTSLSPFNVQLGRLWDMSKGSLHRLNFDILKRYEALLKRDRALAELAEMLGRMQAAEKEYETEVFANTRFRTEWKTENLFKSDLVGIRESDDLSSMLPAESALLGDPVLETVFLKKYAEKKLQTFEFQNRSPQRVPETFQDRRQKAREGKKGPFIVCIDTSGSMIGEPETIAKTLCFAILKIAIRERRKCFLILFSHAVQTINLTDFETSLEALLDFLSLSFGGGTDENLALQEAARQLGTEEYKNGDVLMISDFVTSGLTNETLSLIRAAKKKKAKFHSLVIGADGNAGVIKEFDNNWVYDPSNPDRVITLVRNLGGLRKGSPGV